MTATLRQPLVRSELCRRLLMPLLPEDIMCPTSARVASRRLMSSMASSPSPMGERAPCRNWQTARWTCRKVVFAHHMVIPFFCSWYNKLHL